jgi:hypothetical protein
MPKPKEYWIVESRGNKKAWEASYVRRTEASANQTMARLRRFSERWRETRQYRAVHVIETA